MPNPLNQPITYLAETVGRSAPKSFGIYQPDRLFHTFILGQTGTGKSTLILNMIRQDIEQERGFCLIDPHGDLAEAVKPMLQENVVYWDVADPDCPYGYNPLGYVAEENRSLVVSAIIDALRQQWRDAWGVRMQHLLRFSILALISRPGSSFADIVPMFTNKAFRRTVLQSVTNEEVLKFWKEEFPKLNYKTAFDGVAPIANKLGAFLSNPVVKKVLCSPSHNLRFRSLLDDGTPLVVNLSKGKLGSDISSVLGGLILSMMTSAAFTRGDTPEHQRKQYSIYVDEFASMTTGTIASMLSELRKYRVGLVLAAQYTSAIKDRILDAIFGNVGTIIVFRIGAKDAPVMARQLGWSNPADLLNLPNYRIFIKLMIGGFQSKAFTACSLSSRQLLSLLR